VIKKIKEH